MRWPKKTTVWIPYGKGVLDGDTPYTCGSCFKFNACVGIFKNIFKGIILVETSF